MVAWMVPIPDNGGGTSSWRRVKEILLIVRIQSEDKRVIHLASMHSLQELSATQVQEYLASAISTIS